jgi:hypothetical protein
LGKESKIISKSMISDYPLIIPYISINGGFHSHGGTPNSLDGLFHGKAEDDNWGYPLVKLT